MSFYEKKLKKETKSGESLGVQSRPELHSISYQDHIARGPTIREVGRERGRWGRGERKEENTLTCCLCGSWCSWKQLPDVTHDKASRPWSLRAKGPGVQSELKELAKPSYKRLLQTDSSTFTAWVFSFCWNLVCESTCTRRSHLRWSRTYLQKYFSTNNRKMATRWWGGKPQDHQEMFEWFLVLFRFEVSKR